MQKNIPFHLVVLVFFSLVHTHAYSSELDAESVSLDTARMNHYLQSEAAKLKEEAWQRINTADKLQRERQTLRREFRFMIGLEPLPARTPMHVTHVNTIETSEYTIDILYYQSLPGLYVTANLYKPKNNQAPFPAVIWGPGHSGDPHGAKALRQKYAIPWVRNGYVCLIIDPIQVAEVFGVHRGMHSWDQRHWYARGYTPIGVEVWNAMRAVDYLQSRDDVDGGRITINGVSGGGHLSWMAGAADPRIASVQPVAGTADIFAHVKLDLQRLHCDCAYFINSYRHDWPTLAALIAPRPLLMHNNRKDVYYPPPGYLAVFDRAKEIYTLLGKETQVDMFEVDFRHAYTPEQCKRAVEWSNQWLKNETSPVTLRPFDELEASRLSALGGVSGVHPEDRINHKIQELLIPVHKAEPFQDLQKWQTYRQETLNELRNMVFRNLPDSVRWNKTHQIDQDSYMLETEPGIQIGMMSYIPESAGPKQRMLLYIASPGDTRNTAMWGFIRAYPFKGFAASRHIVFPRGIGSTSWNKTEMIKYERSAMLLGRTLDDMRLYDVLCAIDFLTRHESFDGTEFTVVGKGPQGILAAYAALLNPKVTRVILHSPPLSHKTGPVFLNVLRYTDIPQALAMLAPRELVFLTHEYDSFDYTRDIYRLYDAEGNYRRAYTVAQALNLKN